MIGELNASHTGAAPATQLGATASSPPVSGSISSPIRLPVATAFRMSENGPTDKDWVGERRRLIAIGRKPVKAGEEYWALLNDRLNRKIESHP
jgi:hypothetical protein